MKDKVKYLYIASILMFLSTCSPSRSQVQVDEISGKNFDNVEITKKSQDQEPDDETPSSRSEDDRDSKENNLENSQTSKEKENIKISQSEAVEDEPHNHHQKEDSQEDEGKPPEYPEKDDSEGGSQDDTQEVLHGTIHGKEENHEDTTEDDNEDDSEEDESEENDSIDEDPKDHEAIGQVASSDENNRLSLDEKITLFRKDIQGDQDSYTFNLIYNPLGYSLSIPPYFVKKVQDNYLWYLKHSRNSYYEFQYIIGVSQNTEELTKLLNRVTSKYTRLGKVIWKTPVEIDDEDLQKANALEGMESSSIKQTSRYYNLIATKVLRNKDKTMISFIVGILSLKKGIKDFDDRLKQQKEIFMKVFYSFTFL